MITIWMATRSVPLLPLPPIATLIMPLLEEIKRIMSCRVLSAIQTESYVFLNGNRTSRRQCKTYCYHHQGSHGNCHRHGITMLIMPEEITRMCVYRDLSAIRMEFYYAFLKDNG